MSLTAGSECEIGLRYNVAPTQNAPVVRSEPNGDLVLQMMRWGLVPSWAKDPGIGSRTINARSETAASLPAFRGAFKARRCLVPASGFYEWQVASGGRSKLPWYFRLRDGGVLCFAGLWERWQGQGTAPIETFTILTTTPNGLLKSLHDRMPAVVRPEFREAWLRAGELPSNVRSEVFAPLHEVQMEGYRVGTGVNSPAHDAPDCIRQVPVEPESLWG